MSLVESREFRLCLHGLAVQVRCAIPALEPSLERMLGEFGVDEFPEGFTPVEGDIQPYDESVVLRHLSPQATPVAIPGSLFELYEFNERFWLIDDRWGLCEVNLLKGQFRSWVLPAPTLDSLRTAEGAVLWPLSQALRSRGLSLVPAVAVAREDLAFLILAPFSIEPEIVALVDAGFRIIGQRWTALREEDGRVAMLHLPGCVERLIPPHLRSTTDYSVTELADLELEHPGSTRLHAFCDAVILVEPSRRPVAAYRQLSRGNAAGAIRRAWPIADLHPQRRLGQLPARLAQQCRCYEIQLSRRGSDLLRMIDPLRNGSPAPGMTVTLHPAPTRTVA
jgi:hypothetical protein